jgi:hypothetical protein
MAQPTGRAFIIRPFGEKSNTSGEAPINFDRVDEELISKALAQVEEVFSRSSQAVAAAYAQSPHTFVIGLLSLMLAIQLISLGILSLQSKSYFEEIFHLGSAINRANNKHK